MSTPLTPKSDDDKIVYMTTNVEKVHWGLEPIWEETFKDPLQEACALARAENWYHHMSDEAEHRKWICEFMKSNRFSEEDIKAFSRLGRTTTTVGEVAEKEPGCNLGVLSRLLTRGAPVPEVRKERLLRAIKYLVSRGRLLREEEKSENLPNIQDRIREQVSILIGELEQIEDSFIVGSQGTTKECTDIQNYIKARNIRGVQATRIAEWFRRRIDPIETLLHGKADEQLREAYSIYTKKQLKEYLKWLNCLILACQQQVEISKKLRSPRRRKPKDPIKIVKNLKYKKEDTEWKVKSIPCYKIVGSEKVVLFNTKTRICSILEADTRHGLSVKGTTIIGFDAEKSKSKKLRKPEALLKAIRENGGIRSIKNAFSSSNTQEKEAKGRVNEDTLILAAY
jgi:hypothetical protein